MKVLVRKREKGTEAIAITTPFIKLESFLKLANVVESGGMAKTFIQNGEVMVNGALCQMRGKKLYPGDTVSFDGSNYTVSQGEN